MKSIQIYWIFLAVYSNIKGVSSRGGLRSSNFIPRIRVKNITDIRRDGKLITPKITLMIAIFTDSNKINCPHVETESRITGLKDNVRSIPESVSFPDSNKKVTTHSNGSASMSDLTKGIITGGAILGGSLIVASITGSSLSAPGVAVASEGFVNVAETLFLPQNVAPEVNLPKVSLQRETFETADVDGGSHIETSEDGSDISRNAAEDMDVVEENEGYNSDTTIDDQDIDAMNVETPTSSRSNSIEVISEEESEVLDEPVGNNEEAAGNHPDLPGVDEIVNQPVVENVDITPEDMDGATEMDAPVYYGARSMITRKLLKARVGVADVNIGLTNVGINLQWLMDAVGEHGVIATSNAIEDFGVELSNTQMMESIAQKVKELATYVEEAQQTLNNVANVFRDGVSTIEDKSTMLTEMREIDESITHQYELNIRPEE